VAGGDREGGEALLRQAADRGDISALGLLAVMQAGAGDREGAEAVLRRAASHGDISALLRLARMREVIGDRGGAEVLARQVADYGGTTSLWPYSVDPLFDKLWPNGLDPDGTPTPAWQPSVSAPTHLSPGVS